MRKATQRKARENMIELVTKALCNKSAEDIAEYLLAHGVVFAGNEIPRAADTLFGVWIPTSLALPHFFPERRRSVLVTIEDEDGKRFVTTAKYDEQYKEWGNFTDWRFTNDRFFKIVAWMTKPAPWRDAEACDE